MQNVQVFHVGQPIPMTISDADFHTEQEGDLVVNRGAEVVAQFPAGKWSAVIKMEAPATVTANSLPPIDDRAPKGWPGSRARS